MPSPRPPARSSSPAWSGSGSSTWISASTRTWPPIIRSVWPREERHTPDPHDQIRRTIEHVGGPLLLTTVVLVAGFLSMRLNGLLAIQDMGLVAAATLTVALLADLYCLPALYLVTRRRGQLPVDRASASSPAVSDSSR